MAWTSTSTSGGGRLGSSGNPEADRKKREQEAVAAANALAERNFAMRQREDDAGEQRDNRSLAMQEQMRSRGALEQQRLQQASGDQQHARNKDMSQQQYGQNRQMAVDQQGFRERSAQQGADLQRVGREQALRAALVAARKGGRSLR